MQRQFGSSNRSLRIVRRFEGVGLSACASRGKLILIFVCGGLLYLSYKSTLEGGLDLLGMEPVHEVVSVRNLNHLRLTCHLVHSHFSAYKYPYTQPSGARYYSSNLAWSFKNRPEAGKTYTYCLIEISANLRARFLQTCKGAINSVVYLAQS